MSEIDWTKPRVAIVGAGAIGGYYGAKLARAGCDVHFLLRADYDAVRERGLSIRESGGDFDLPQVQAHASTHEIGVCDLVIVALKATANDALPALLPPLLHRHTALLSLQNGLGNEEFLARHFGAERVLGGVCFVCLNRIAPGVIRNSGHGNIALGEFDAQQAPPARLEAIARLFRQSGVGCQSSDDLRQLLWDKLVWNIPFNGLAIAGNGATVADVLGDAGLLALARELMAEVIAAARALGCAMAPDFTDFQVERSRVMGDYQPSSLSDFQAGRAVEVEAIWGEPLRQGQRAGVELPRLEMLTRLIGWRVAQRDAK